MKRKQVWLAAVLSLLMLVFAGTALAAADSLSFAMDLSASEFIEPKTVSVSFTVTNTGSDDMPGPVKLFYPDGQQVAEFGEPVLAAGASRNWTGNWTVTQGELEAGKISFKVVYSDHDENGEVKEYALAVSKRIQYKGTEPKIEVTRTIMPAVAQEGQTVSIIYDIANTGSADITGVTIQDSAAGKEKESVGDIPAGETVRHIFTVTMKKKDVTSQATLTYKANRKTYTSKVDAAVIKYGKVNLTAQLSADKKGGVPGETVKLTLTLKNSGKEDFTDITVTDETLGTVFSGQAVKAGETVKLEKDLTITESQELLFTVRGSDSAGGQVETATGKVEITAKDPSRQILLAVEAAADKTEVYPIPGGVVRFTITVTNEGNIDAENVSVKAGSATMYTFGRIPAGESRSFTREAEISMAGTFQFTAGTKDQLGETVSFSSNTIPITLGSASANSAPAARQGEWPQPKAEGIDVLDLTGYALKDATTEQKTRTEVMNNGLLLINEWHARPADFDESGLKRIN